MALLTVPPDEASLARTAAERMATLVQAAIATRGNAVVCLTGGRTPRELYRLLGSREHHWHTRIDWPRVHLFWGDERHVPPDDPASNYGMARTALLQHVPVVASQVHRMRGELPDAADAAREYDRLLLEAFAAAGRSDLRFDVMLLGLGPDAHIASIFPGSPLLGDNGTQPRGGARVAAVPGPDPGTWRITLTPHAIVDADVILMIVSGAAKADAVYAALLEEEDVRERPAQLLRAEGDRVEWLVDRAAAARLPPDTTRVRSG
jgi:6-phosphogluconolactonase